MFRFWLHFHPLLVLLALLFVFSVAGGLIHWLQSRSPWHWGLERRALAAPTFVAVSTLFALFAAFLLANVVAQKNRALQAVQNESAALLTLGIDSEIAGPSGPIIRKAIVSYARSVVADEWPRLIEESSSPKTEQALLALMRSVRDVGSDNVKPAVHGQMLTLVQKVADARADRIAIVTNHVQQFAWTALFVLGFLTQFGIGMGNLERPAANACAILVFSLGAVVALWLIAIQDNPFRGPSRVEAAPIEKVTALIAEKSR